MSQPGSKHASIFIPKNLQRGTRGLLTKRHYQLLGVEEVVADEVLPGTNAPMTHGAEGFRAFAPRWW